MEAYYVDDIEDKSSRTMYHLILVAITENARKHINRIMSVANTDGYYYKPRIDLNLLLSLPADEVVVTTACIAGRMFKEDWEEKFLKPVYKHFSSNFYLEVQSHVDHDQAEYNKKILELKSKYKYTDEEIFEIENDSPLDELEQDALNSMNSSIDSAMDEATSSIEAQILS